MKKITVRKVDWRIFIVNLITVVVPLYFIVSYAYTIQNTTMQTVFIICALSIVGGINFLIVKSGTYLIDIILKDNEIEILAKDKVIYSSNYLDIQNYNTYNFINKKGGYIVRLKNANQSFCSLLTWIEFTKASPADQENYNIIKDTLHTKLPNKKKMTGKDYLLKIFSAMPYIFLAIAVLSLIGIFIYIIFYLK
ncbi:MAG: hypothetical protein P0Y62_18195 [Candidatus Chryseobacterium colombiense]|nr:hypothetical protein [Chryseobacterium sp.]WEK69733.1 MAG: hypothetical protein P0Y62_18195 [Chryseobacterium sp.]